MADAHKTADGHGAGTARLKAWAVNPSEGGRLFRWSEPGALERAAAFYRDKIPAHMLGRWCVDLSRAAAAR